MKHTLKLTAMLAAVLMLAACNKEKELTPDTVATTQERDITYTIADRTTTVHLETDTEFEALLVQFCNYAQQGDSVTFYNANRGNKGVAAKDVATYSTTNREEMIRWMRQMEEAGKTVTITYDPNTGTYNGMAYATAPQPQIDGTLWVDLGLPSGLLWASCNVGAQSPEERGDYFAWGETAPKEIYSWETYIYGTLLQLTKYNSNPSHGHNGYTDTLTILEPCDDAATANMGAPARTPTILEWIELVENTTHIWVENSVNGTNGIRFISTNGNSIFLPATGYISQWGGPNDSLGRCMYWSASLDVSGGAYDIDGRRDTIYMPYPDYSHYRYIGEAVRAVRPKR